MNAANLQYCTILAYKTIAKMCEERITHTELNAHQSNLNIDFLLHVLSRLSYQSVLPIKRPTTMVSVDTVHFQGKVSNYF